MYEYSTNSGSGCYLTTIMSKLLHYSDDNYYLNTLRSFRDNVMINNPEYIPLLLTYDIIGPQISDKLEHDKSGIDIAKVFFNRYIISAVNAIENGKEEHAINIYKTMTIELANHYNINPTIVNIDINNIDTSNLGHGKVRKLATN